MSQTMTLTKLKNDVASFIGLSISGTSRVTTTEVEQWINTAYYVAISKLADADINYYQGEISREDSDTNTEGRYVLPTNFLKMKRLEVRYGDGEDMVWATPVDINQFKTPMHPDSDSYSEDNPYYALWENDFYIRPIPTEASATAWSTNNGEAFRLWYIERPDDLTNGSDVPNIPYFYQHILSYFAANRALRKLGKVSDAREYERDWQLGLKAMVKENTEKDISRDMGFTISRGRNKQAGIWRP